MERKANPDVDASRAEISVRHACDNAGKDPQERWAAIQSRPPKKSVSLGVRGRQAGRRHPSGEAQG